MTSKIYWVEGPWTGRLGIAARPRGGDWLAKDLEDWKVAGIKSIVSLLTPAEQSELDLDHEQEEVRSLGLKYLSFPIPDLQVPASDAQLAAVLEKLDADLASGKNVVVHCRGGIGRSGLIAACLLAGKGISPGAAVEQLTAARGRTVPETDEQRKWIDRYAATLAGTR